ncbi:D-glycero-alpha-D-manno-heptose-1,7-bisphosphate 7-phosphatase [Arcticibacter sp.]|uniref:D-glycero-alpha-D-manno-heptose-1,7-bisphosphate 7-phosphatase n=1 Tax=Arcticibacter sp. TaxID=1872630 RepID=UPI00388E5A9D
MRSKAVFMDKDGTLIVDVPFNVNPDLIRLQAHAIEGLKRIKQLDYELIVITNQSGVAHGYFEESELRQVEEKLRELLAEHDLSLDAFYYCPHHPEGSVGRYAIDCGSRKPQPGMILKAAEDRNIDLNESWMIGDILHDIEAGNRAGCRTILIDNGNETEWMMNDFNHPDFTVRTINDAATKI